MDDRHQVPVIPMENKLLYPIWEIHCRYLNREFDIEYIPTETVLTEPKLAVPVQRRIYRVGWFLRNGRAIPYSDLVARDDFNGTSKEEEVRLAEVWSEVGDDGHTKWELACYTWTTERIHKRLSLHDYDNIVLGGGIGDISRREILIQRIFREPSHFGL